MTFSNLNNGLGNNSKERNNVNNAFLKFSKSDNISTNERSRSRNCISNSRKNVSNQRLAGRKRKAEESGDNLDQRTPKLTRFNSE